MAKTNKILFFLIIALIIIFFASNQWLKQKDQPIEELKSETINITLSIQDFTDTALQLEITQGISVFNVLENMNDDNPSLNLKSKSYEGLGVMVEQLGDLTNGTDNRYWQYNVNSEQPMVSADKYILQNNDIIEWLFEESKF